MIEITNKKKLLNFDNIVYIFSDFLLFLFAFRFLNKNNTFLLLYVFLCLFFVIIHNRMKLSFELLFLLLYGLTYYYINKYWNSENASIGQFYMIGIGAPLMYFSGMQYVNLAKNKEKYYLRVCIILSFGMSLFAILSYLKNGVLYDYTNGRDLRLIPDLWLGKDLYWHATNINGYCSSAIVVAIVFILQNKKGMLRVISWIMLIGSIYISLITAGRTNLFLALLVVLFYCILSLLLKKNLRYISKQNATKILLFIILFLMLLPIIAVNLENILVVLPLDAFIERLSSRQLSIKNDSRWEMWSTVINDIPSHFWGNIKSVNAAHNLYLDVARVAGVIPMVILIIFTIMILFTTWQFVFNSKFSKEIRMLGCVFIVSMLISFMIEPVMDAKPYIFIMFCMVCGMNKEMCRVNDKCSVKV